MAEILDLLIPEARIQARIAALARDIDRDYAGTPPSLLVVLKGAVIFAVDLMRRISIPVTVEFASASSYGHSTRSSGTIALAGFERLDVAGRQVIVIEDILDTGGTARALVQALREKDPAGVAVLPLLRKPAALSLELPVRDVGFDIADDFVVGYGMDYAERYRNLRDVCRLRFSRD